jgi:hypothetical protein
MMTPHQPAAEHEHECNFKRIALCYVSLRHAGGCSQSSCSICCELDRLRHRFESWSRSE